MEIERKFLVKKEDLPKNLEQYPKKVIEQGYLCTDPVVRIRQSNDSYYLTYKSRGLLAREEYNLPLTREAYEHLKPKADGIVISKIRYVIPEKDGLYCVRGLLTLLVSCFIIPFPFCSVNQKQHLSNIYVWFFLYFLLVSVCFMFFLLFLY